MYTADVPADLTQNPGEYNLSVTATSAWTRSGSKASCVLFHRVITVQADAKQIILASCVAALLVVSGGGFAFMLYRNRARAREYLRSIFSLELFLAVDICVELWVRPIPFCVAMAWSPYTSRVGALCRTLGETASSSLPSAATGTKVG